MKVVTIEQDDFMTLWRTAALDAMARLTDSNASSVLSEINWLNNLKRAAMASAKEAS